MSTCTSCKVELVEGTNWSVKGRHKFCRACFKSKYNKKRMFLDGKYVPITSKIHKPGIFKSLDDAWSHVELDNKDVSGEIYIMTNKAFKGWVKVGMSINANDRLNNYQTGDPHRSYKLYSKFYTEDRHETEGQIHQILGARYKRQNEWFNAKAQEVEWIISQYFGVRYEERNESTD